MNIDVKKECIKCGGKIEKGYIQSTNKIAWVPKLSKLIVEPTFINDSVILSNQSLFSINYVDAYLCKKCKSVYIDYSSINKLQSETAKKSL